MGCPMAVLDKSAKAWRTEEFDGAFKAEVAALGLNGLPLQQGLSLCSMALDSNVSVVVLTKSATADIATIKAGIFYTGLVAGCNCADDPTPEEEQNEYCEVLVSLNLGNGDAEVSLLT